MAVRVDQESTSIRRQFYDAELSLQRSGSHGYRQFFNRPEQRLREFPSAGARAVRASLCRASRRGWPGIVRHVVLCVLPRNPKFEGRVAGRGTRPGKNSRGKQGERGLVAPLAESPARLRSENADAAVPLCGQPGGAPDRLSSVKKGRRLSRKRALEPLRPGKRCAREKARFRLRMCCVPSYQRD